MEAELTMGGVGYWFGFSLLAAMHFFVREFNHLQSTLALRLWRAALSLLLVVGVFSFVFFSGYAFRTFPVSKAHLFGFFMGLAVYAIFAWFWTRNVKRPT
jgi:hypothetical protein